MPKNWPIDWSLVISGGGSGGHLTPAIAVCEAIKNSECPPARIVVFTAQRQIDEFVIRDHGLESVSLCAVESQKFVRHPVRSLWQTWQATREATRVLLTLLNPVVMATGGYSCIPGGLAAWRKSIPLVLLEQNRVAGRATSLLAPLSDRIFTSLGTDSFPEKYRSRVLDTGNPVLKKNRDLLDVGPLQRSLKKQILVLGGSQGSRRINQSLVDFVEKHRDDLQGWKLVHHTGVSERESIAARYHSLGIDAEVSHYFSDLPEHYRRSRFAVSRAGGTTLAELACQGLPALLIPYPNSLRQHQSLNAMHFTDAGAACLLEEATPHFEERFTEQLLSLMTDDDRVQSMSDAMLQIARPQAAADVAEGVLNLVKTRFVR